MNSISSIGSSPIISHATRILQKPETKQSDDYSPSTIVNLGSTSPKIGTGVDAYRTVEQMGSTSDKSDIANTLVTLMMLDLIASLM